jgi:coat protein Gp5
MANTLTGLIPTIYTAADRVLREQQGFLPAVYLNPSAEQAAKDQDVTYPVVPAVTASDVTPAAVPTEPSGQTIGTGTMKITKSRKVGFVWNGEEEASIGGMHDRVKNDQFSQAFRTLSNEIESDLFTAAKGGGSRAYGTAGATPFGTAADLTDLAEVGKIMRDNGAWTDDMHMVLNTTAGAKIRGKQSGLFKVNEAGTTDLLRDAKLGRLEGFDMHESGQIVVHTKGTGTSYVFNGSHAVGATTVVAKTGSGTVVAGDVLAFEDDTTNKYVVNTGITAPGSAVIGKPGLRQAQTDGKTITIGNNYTGNWALERYALHLLTRVPKLPKEGALGEHEVITDPFSGVSFLVSLYPGYHEVIIEVAVAWGVKAVKSEGIVLLLG